MNTSNLHHTLNANAAFSFASGLLLTIAPGTVAGWLRIDGDGSLWIRLGGIVLLSHAALIVALLPRLGLKRSATLNLIAIAPYPALMVALVATGLIDRGLGVGLALADGLIIAAMATSLVLGLRRPALQGQPQHA